MIKNIFLEVEYEGTAYWGWQIQNSPGTKDKKLRVKTIQEEIEKAIKKLFNQEIRVVFTGRTDRGVHAKAQGVNFKVAKKIPLKNIKRALNSFLPADIGIKRVKEVPLDFHSRFSVDWKIYRYIIFKKKEPSVFWRNFSWHIPQTLDLDKMKSISKKLIGKNNFSMFAREAKKYKSCVREIKDISFKKKNGFIYIDIQADGFLRSMARNIVAFLVKVGEGKLSLSEATAILKGKAPYINKSAPASGLYLYKVKYKL
jgi:tRNA pseudouridine38-40 synthase